MIENIFMKIIKLYKCSYLRRFIKIHNLIDIFLPHELHHLNEHIRFHQLHETHHIHQST